MNYIKQLFTGRLSRKNFILSILLCYLVVFIFGFAASDLKLSDEVFSQWIIGEFLVWALWLFGISIFLRRMHDLNWGNVISVILAIILGFPFVGGILFLIICFSKSNNINNLYGNPDKYGFFESVFRIKPTERIL